MRRLVFLAALLPLLLGLPLSVHSAPSFSVDFGPNDSRAEKTYGWNPRNERQGTNTFCWIRGLAADLEIDLPTDSDYRIDIYARPFFYDNCRQTFALFVNGRYVDEWVCRHDQSWSLHKYSSVVTSDLLSEDVDRLTFRCSYESHHRPQGYSLAVGRIVFTPIESVEDTEKKLGVTMIVLAVCIVAAYMSFKIVISKRKGMK